MVYRINVDKINAICKKNDNNYIDKCIFKIEFKEELRAFFLKLSSKCLEKIMLEAGHDVLTIPRDKDLKINWLIDKVVYEGIIFKEDAQEQKQEEEEREEEWRGQEQAQGKEEDTEKQEVKEDISSFFRSIPKKNFHSASKDEVSIGRPPVIHEDAAVCYGDNFLIKCKDIFFRSPVLILSTQTDKIVAIGEMKYDADQSDVYHLVFPRDNISFENMSENSRNYTLCLFRKKVDGLDVCFDDITQIVKDNIIVTSVPCSIDYEKKVVDRNSILCIDFGTSNTAAGTYGINQNNPDEISLVTFTDTIHDNRQVHLLPTIVYVEDCSDRKNIAYLFGYDAKKKIMEKSYCLQASVFFEIKRWIGALDEKIKIKDENENYVWIARRDIVKAYLLHVLNIAENVFKRRFCRLHFSAPVKMKTKYFNSIQEILKPYGYELIPIEETIDEGVAIIYQTLANYVKAEVNENKETNIMILDCGGGTTDLASCMVKKHIQPDGAWKVHLHTNHVKGDPNFGGNNITYRILQLLKIKLAIMWDSDYMNITRDTNKVITELIPLTEDDILDLVAPLDGNVSYDRTTYAKIYKNFDAAYQKAERIFPTRFGDSEKYVFNLEDLKRNFYYLWQVAEKVKIKFYEQDAVSIGFQQEDNPLQYDPPEDDFLFLGDGKDVRKLDHPAKNVKITINEIKRVLCGDIFLLLTSLMPEKPEEYKYYKLAGQSCKINLFMELLKEFVPGRKLRISRYAKGSKEDWGSIKLKLDCIQGCISYVRDMKKGIINPVNVTKPPRLNYNIFQSRGEKKSPILLCKTPENLYCVTYPHKATRPEFVVCPGNHSDIISRRFELDFDDEVFTHTKSTRKDIIESAAKMSGLKIESKIFKALGEQLKSIKPLRSEEMEKIHIVFAVPALEGYGIIVYILLKEETESGEFYHWRTQYEDFEDNMKGSFFDGTK